MKRAISVKIDQQLENDIREEAKKQNIGHTTLIRQIVKEYLDKKKDICD